MSQCKVFHSIILGILTFLFAQSLIAGKQSMPEIASPEHIVLSATVSLERLHRLKIGHTKSVEESMEYSIAVDAKVLNEILENGSPAERDTIRIYKTLRLLSVMNEQFEIEQWRNDRELQSIFKKAQENDPKHTNKLRCFNWTEPMWVAPNNCTE